MSIRLPLQTVLDYTDTGNVGGGSVAGGVAKTFFIPQDTDNIVIKLIPSVTGGSVSATLQTTDNGGTTWYDVVRTPTVALATGGEAGGLALWRSVPVFGSTVNNVVGSVVATGSVVTTNSQATAAASTLGAGAYSGLPILSQLNRIFLIYTGDQTVNNTRVKVMVNNQSSGPA